MVQPAFRRRNPKSQGLETRRPVRGSGAAWRGSVAVALRKVESGASRTRRWPQHRGFERSLTACSSCRRLAPRAARPRPAAARLHPPAPVHPIFFLHERRTSRFGFNMTLTPLKGETFSIDVLIG